jgi:hypothetical protein
MLTVPSAIDEALERLVDPPTDQSSSLTLLAKIKQETKPLPTLAEHRTYTEYINNVWSGEQDLSLAKERKSLIGDVGVFDELLRNQIELAQHTQAIDDELRTAWNAAQKNATIARDVYQKANFDIATQRDELQRLQVKIPELERDKSIKGLLVIRHKEVLGEIRAQAQVINDTSSKVKGIKTTGDIVTQRVSGMADADTQDGPFEEMKYV